jgi:SGNH domain (fused to AT3 domains)
LAWATFRFIEKPIRQTAFSEIKLRLLIIGVFGIGLVGYLSKESDGLPSRFQVPELVRTNQMADCNSDIKNGVLNPCTFGNQNSEKTILIYGDSHAGHLTAALNQKLGNDFRFIFLGHGTCFLSKLDGADKDEMCRMMWGEVSKLRHKALYAVIHAQRWGGLTSEEEENDMQRFFLVAGLSPEKIAIVGSIPDVDLDCEIANYYIPSRKRICIGFDEQYKNNLSFILKTKKLDPPKNLMFFYPYEKLCPNNKCNVIEGSVANYWDDRHMSKDGALMAVPDLIDFLKH